MKFIKLARLFSDLESTSKRLEMTDFLADFFKAVIETKDFKEIDKIIYLIQGQLVSSLKPIPKLGLAEKSLLEIVLLHAGVDRIDKDSKEKVKRVLVKTGDIGSTAEYILLNMKKQRSLIDFSPDKNKKVESIEITELYSELEKLAKTVGSGSHDDLTKRSGILRGVLEKISPRETNYLFRIITSTLRVGVSTQTIIDGLALGFTGSKENRDIIENAFNLHPDLGDITIILAEKGIEEVEKIEITYGVPIRMMLASRVPYVEIADKLGTPFIGEYKLDGERLQIHKEKDKVLLFSRRLLEISAQYPDVCQVIRENIKAEKVIMEGEVVAIDPKDPDKEAMLPFQVLSKRRRKYDVESTIKEIPVCVFLFDILKCEEQTLVELPFPQRRKKLVEIVEERDELKLVKSVKINNTEELVDFFNLARNKGTEGVMTKSILDDSVYQAGNRGFIWIKLKGLEGGKLLDSVDVVIIGAFYGKGKRTGVYGTYIGALYDRENDIFEGFTRVASGLTDEIME